MLEITGPADPQAVARFCERLDAFDWAFFVSANAVNMAVPAILEKRTCPESVRIAVIGKRSAGELQRFGLVADLALALNLVFIVALLSLLQATLTMPGIAGIVLTVGMAVDANVLIFERIREELRNGNTPQASIHAGYAKALSTIADANVTTLIAAIVLFSFGTGPIKGFAVTLSLGIITSMFTSIMGTRAVINLIYGGRRLQRLPI